MKRHLRRAYLLVNVVTMVFVTLFFAALLHQEVEGDHQSLRAILNTATAWTGEATSNLRDLARKIADSSPALRVRFFLPGGIVLADSEARYDEPAPLEGREVQLALTGGIGHRTAWRQLLSPTLYAAAPMGDGQMILHLSYQDARFRDLMRFAAPAYLLLFAVIHFSARFFMRPVTTKLTGQLGQIHRLLEGVIAREDIDADGFYPELKPAMQDILRQIDRMRYDLKQIEGTLSMQGDFVNNTSHELKSPLTSILGFSELLEESPHMPENKRCMYVGFIRREAERMLSVIDDILLLQQDVKPEPESLVNVDLRRTALEVRQSLTLSAEAADIRITVNGSMRVRAQERDMWELLSNLMSNAVRYGKPGGLVEVTMAGRVMTVRDDGIGIAREHLPRIFEKFYRADKARSRNAGGTGLGLSIVAGILHRYGASIKVDSEEGKGTRFVVTFPETREGESNHAEA